jgi:hypothetical protein
MLGPLHGSNISITDGSYLENKAPAISVNTFYYQSEDFDATRFNEYWPYQLRLLRVDGEDGNGNTTYKATPWVFTLPIPPQELTINMPIASTVQATLNGVVEQHGGAPFRDIILTGTTGITPIKNRASPKDADDRALRTGQAIFAGTTNAANRAIRDTQTLVSGSPTFTPNINQGLGDDSNSIPAKSTGYFQFRLLEKFIESYVELKKRNTQETIDGITFNTRDLRLAFCVWKDESVYLCTGVQFQRRRSAANPMEYMYTLQLRAWKRIRDIQGIGIIQLDHQFVARKPNFYAALLTRINAINAVLEDTVDIFHSIVQDPLNRLTEITRETSLFIKNTINVALTLNDFSHSTVKDILPVLVKNWNTVSSQLGLDPIPPPELSNPSKTLGSALQPAIADIFNRVNPNSLPISTVLVNKIQQEKNQTALLTRLDFEKRRDEIKQFSDDFADAIGASSDLYDDIYNRPHFSTIKTPTDDEFSVLFALNEAAMVLDHLAASATVDPPKLTSLEYVAGLAEKSGIAFKVPLSKFAVPFPYGFTLERLAQQYLGDANRWHEIATLNGLREPFVDEEGFKLPFLTNGDANSFYVSDKSNLYINQIVFISSTTKNKSKRRITDINEITPTYNIITVDGTNDLDDYKLSEGAVLESFLPGTVNSQQIIYIPSDKRAPEDPKTKAVPGVDQFDPLLQISGIDFLLTQNGDLAVTSDGDIRLAYGLQNIIQTIKLALSTPKGTLLQHPEYGIDLQIGTSTADVSAEDIVRSALQLFGNDPTFNGVKSAQIVKQGPVLSVTLVLDLKGLSSNLPVTFNIKS